MDSKSRYFDSLASKYNQRSKGFVWSLLRTAEKKTIESRLPDSLKNKDVLEVGPGSGFYSHLLMSKNPKTFTCVDISLNMLNQINIPEYSKIHADIEHLEIDRKFDLIFCAGALEFTSSPQKALESIANMLQEDGIFLILYPRDTWKSWTYKLYHKYNGMKCHIFNPKQLKKTCKSYNLDEIDYINCSLFSAVSKYKKYVP